MQVHPKSKIIINKVKKKDSIIENNSGVTQENEQHFWLIASGKSKSWQQKKYLH